MTSELPDGYVRVLDKGYVGLLGVHGDDTGLISPPSAARTSFKKRPSEYTEEQNKKLVDYLIRNQEYSCLRHNVMTLEIRFPLMVARQLFKYIVGSNWTEDQFGWNENSKRYITEENEFYIPKSNQWRSAPDNKKQGSGQIMDAFIGQQITEDLLEWVEEGEKKYQFWLERGAAAEQVRLFNAANGMYVTTQWTGSLNSILHLLDERLEHGAQYETQQYAKVIAGFVKQSFPAVYESWSRQKANEAETKLFAQKFRDIMNQESNKSWIKKILGK